MRENWFAAVGTGVLTLGVLFTLALPYPGLPSVAPAAVGYLAAAAAWAGARSKRRSFAQMAGYLRAAAMAVFYFATIRLCFFGSRPFVPATSMVGELTLTAAVTVNLALGWRWRSPWLTGLALLTGAVTVLAVGTPEFVLLGLTALAAAAATVRHRLNWPAFGICGVIITYATFLLWAVGDPLLGRPLGLIDRPPAVLGALLLWIPILAVGCRDTVPSSTETAAANLGALFNCGAASSLLLVLAWASFGPWLVSTQVATSVVFLGVAIGGWIQRRSRVATFLYAMTGYLALTAAIIRAAGVPQVFAWLALQSLIVIATAIWFQSRLIVVANFAIYVAIVVTYVPLARVETGISVAFGVVALLSARLLNWQRSRLELKTDLMRNIYLICALLVFPYALYHLAPRSLVSAAWIGLAFFYYGMGRVARNSKYRWMGHATLLFTVLDLVVVEINRLSPVFRSLSFLGLGLVLIVASLIFARQRRGSKSSGGS